MSKSHNTKYKIKFKLKNSLTGEVIGYEYLTDNGWVNKVFDYEERPGAFDVRELGDGFNGFVTRHQFVTHDMNGEETYEGDTLRAPSGILFKVIYNDEQMKWQMKKIDGYSVFNINAPLLINVSF